MNGELPLALGDTGGHVVGGLQRAEPRRPHPGRTAGPDASRSPSSASTGRSRRRRATTSGCELRRSTSTRPSARPSRGEAQLEIERRPGLGDPRPADAGSSGSPAASSSPRARCGRATARCSSARRTRTPSTAGRRTGAVTVFRSKSGYTGLDIGRYHQPGSNGLTFDPEGRLTICQHGNRRVLRVNPHGDTRCSPTATRASG